MSSFSSALTLSSIAYTPKTAAPRLLRRTMRCCSAAAVSTQFELRDYWTSLSNEVGRKLNDAVPLKYPELIHEAMRYSLLPKTAVIAPPVMCVAACELFGVERAAALPTACALEMVHVASFVHDDLPYIDDALIREGQPSNHTRYGADMAILVGDALLPGAFQHIVLQTPTQLVSQDRLLRVIAEIARTVGSTGMASGGFLDIEGDPRDVEFVHQKKFGELGRCSAVCGAILGGASDDEIQRLGEYGQTVGVLYQVVEDILKAKRAAKKGKSYVCFYGVEKAIEVVDELKSRAKKELNAFEKYGDKVLPLYNFIDYVVERV